MHLGAKPDAGKSYSEARGAEIWNTFAKVIDVCETQEIDLLLIAGDLFHRQPLLRELKEVNYLFSKLTRTKVVFIAGNHDYMKWNSYYRTFQWNSNVYPLLGDQLEAAEFPKLETCIYGFSYYQKEIRENKYRTAKPWGKQKYEILLAHGGDESHIPVKREELNTLGYDYIAMGHIHKPGAIEENKIRYSGALEPIDKNDTGVHGYIYGEIKNDTLKTKFIPFALREYVHMEIKVEEYMTVAQIRETIKQKIEEKGEQNIFKIILNGFTDLDEEFLFSGIDVFDNVIEIISNVKPAYKLEKLKEQNQNNLLGRYIESLENSEPDSIEYQALYIGVEALLETKRG